jgi:hypothetical protein
MCWWWREGPVGDAEKRPAAAHRAIRIREKRMALPVSSCRGRVGRCACRGDPVPDDPVLAPCDEDIPRGGDRR